MQNHRQLDPTPFVRFTATLGVAVVFLALATGVFGTGDAPSAGPVQAPVQAASRTLLRGDAATWSGGLAAGPVAGMPRSTYEHLTVNGGVWFLPSLGEGPVAGMPRTTYESLTGRT